MADIQNHPGIQTAATIPEPAPQGMTAESTAVFPPAVRRWLLASLGILLAAAAYLIAVRGSVILFDLKDAVSSMCF